MSSLFGSCFKNPLEAFKSPKKYDYDLIVIGGGPGGNSVAREAASLGARTLILDHCRPSMVLNRWNDLGGTCVHGGAIPMKIASYICEVGVLLQDAIHYGWQLPFKDIDHDWTQFATIIEEHTSSVSAKMEEELEKLHVDYLGRFGVFETPHVVKFAGGHSFSSKNSFSARYIVIATGSRPHYIRVPGVEHCITTDDLLGLDACPNKVLIIGCGTLGIVCANIFKSFGSDTTVLVRSQMLKEVDSQMADMVQDFLQKRGIRIIRGVTPRLIHKLPNEILRVFWYDKHKTLGFDLFNAVVLATGRIPDIKDLQLEKAGVKLCHHGDHIKTVNEQTNIPHIYALGDAQCKKYRLCSCATRTGVYLARRLFGRSTELVNQNDIIPQFLHVIPEYGWVGMTEQEAIKKYGDDNVEVYHSYYQPMLHLVPKKNFDLCYVKVITLRQGQQKVLGMHIIGPAAGEMIQGFAVAMNTNHLTMAILHKTVGIWSTTAAQFVMVHITKRSGLYPYVQECLV